MFWKRCRTTWLDKHADKMVAKYKKSNIHSPHVSAWELAVIFMQIRKKDQKESSARGLVLLYIIRFWLCKYKSNTNVQHCQRNKLYLISIH